MRPVLSGGADEAEDSGGTKLQTEEESQARNNQQSSGQTLNTLVFLKRRRTVEPETITDRLSRQTARSEAYITYPCIFETFLESVSPNQYGQLFLQKTASKLVKFGLCSSISDLQTPIGGHHPMLYFPSQIQRNIVLCYAKLSPPATLPESRKQTPP